MRFLRAGNGLPYSRCRQLQNAQMNLAQLSGVRDKQALWPQSLCLGLGMGEIVSQHRDRAFLAINPMSWAQLPEKIILDTNFAL